MFSRSMHEQHIFVEMYLNLEGRMSFLWKKVDTLSSLFLLIYVAIMDICKEWDETGMAMEVPTFT